MMGVERTVRILQAIGESESTNLADLARATNLSEATVLRYLNTLSNLGFVARPTPNRYSLGWEVFRLGQKVSSGFVPREVVRPVLEKLLAQFNETVNFAYRRGDEVVIAEVLEGNRAVKKLNDVGQVDPWHASALGKALLSTMQDEEWRRLLERTGMRRLTGHTIVDKKRMAAEIELTRERGFAVDAEECDEDLTCVAAVVPTATETARFAISVSFLSHRLPPEGLDAAGASVAAAADEIGRGLEVR
jgi:IclR family transcriptional regulator, acetate operon repressor